MTHDELTQTIVSHGDGHHYFVAKWDGKARDYVVDPTTRFADPTAAELAGARPMGSRLVRYTVHQGAITTTRRLT